MECHIVLQTQTSCSYLYPIISMKYLYCRWIYVHKYAEFLLVKCSIFRYSRYAVIPGWRGLGDIYVEGGLLPPEVFKLREAFQKSWDIIGSWENYHVHPCTRTSSIFWDSNFFGAEILAGHFGARASRSNTAWFFVFGVWAYQLYYSNYLRDLRV